MRIYNSINDLQLNKQPVVTVGVFDGVHLGHVAILQRLVYEAKRRSTESLVITFDPHPRLVLYADGKKVLLNTLNEKLKLIEKQQVDNVLVIPFTKEFATNNSSDFIRKILVDKIHVSHVVVGYDHNFGHNREGDYAVMKKNGEIYNFSVEEVKAFQFSSQVVSSSEIRNKLFVGEVEMARNMLGYPYTIEGKVVTGNKIGRNIGFPTANLKPDSMYKLIVGQGVYTSLVEIEGVVYRGMTNVGYRPTLDADNLTIETNIFDFEDDVYGKNIKTSFFHRLRSEYRFPSLDALKSQLNADRNTTKELLKKI